MWVMRDRMTDVRPFQHAADYSVRFFTSWKLLYGAEKIIYVHYIAYQHYIFLLPFLWFAKVILHKKIVIQIHEYWKYLPYQNFAKAIDLLYTRVADRIIVHNNDQFSTLSDLGYKNIDIMYLPVENFIVDKKIPRKSNEICILMNWFILRKKWYDIGIRALSLLPETYSMKLIGSVLDKKYFQEILNLIKSLHLENRIEVIGKFVPDIEIENYINESDILLYPYIISTASAALTEWALKYEKPFLTSNLESFVDYLWTDKYSFISWDAVDLTKKILEINIGNAIRTSIEYKAKYSWKKRGQELLNIFSTL